LLDTSGIAISTAAHYQLFPAVAFDGRDFLVAWQDERNGPDTSDIYGARATTGGTVLDEFPVVMQDGDQSYPALCRGPGSQMFLVYQGWAGTVGGKTYNLDRIWGKMNPVPGVEERENGEVRRVKSGATIVRSVLFLGVDSRQNTVHRAVLLDISGRKVLALHPGTNDVRALAPGVYFVRQAPAQVTSKVVIAR
jgi:hypothetical protein